MPPQVTQTGYGSIQHDKDEERQQLLGINADEARDINSGSCFNRRNGLLLGGLVLCSLLLVHLPFLKHGKHNNVAPQGWIPDEELGLQSVIRAEDASPSAIWGTKIDGPLPTNSWYLVCSNTPFK